MDTLRFTTAGSVDDGKSTLIGRLLYDSHVLLEDQLHAITSADDKKINLAFVTDGLKAEREQGITIDVAYRYFNTAKRKFIVIDAPGHERYTRNMITGASQARAMLLMVDAQNGLVEQTKRHAVIASLMGIESMIVCVNKMDLVDYHQRVYDDIVTGCKALAETLRIKQTCFIPISALNGDNVVVRSTNMNWYDGPSLLDLLENISVDDNANERPLRLSVQHLINRNNHQAVSGFVWSGTLNVGDNVKILPAGADAKVISMDSMNGPVSFVTAMRGVTLQLSDRNVRRGDLLVPHNNLPDLTDEFDVTCCWLHENPLRMDVLYVLRIGTLECNCTVIALWSRLDIHTMKQQDIGDDVRTNDIVRMRIKTSSIVALDNYYRSRYTGSMILIDVNTGETLAAAVYGESNDR